MPTDLTGTPTSLGIGTYNVDDDAPSGLGFNEAMAQIDALLASRVTTPAGIAAGEAMIWNGSAWVRSSNTPLTANGITGVVKPSFRKTAATQVVNTTAETFLIGVGEVTLGAGLLGLTGAVRLRAWGDLKNNSANAVFPKFIVYLGSTKLFDTGTGAASNGWLNSASRYPFSLSVDILNLNSAASQWATLLTKLGIAVPSATSAAFALGEGAYTSGSSATGAEAFGVTNSAVDTSAARDLKVSVTLPVASALCDVTLQGAVVEIL